MQVIHTFRAHNVRPTQNFQFPPASLKPQTEALHHDQNDTIPCLEIDLTRESCCFASTMSLQGATDAVREGVEAVTETLQNASIDTVTNAATTSTPNFVLDEATGEMVSKTELKKRIKNREKEAKKAEREAARPPPPQAKNRPTTAEEDESTLNPNVC